MPKVVFVNQNSKPERAKRLQQNQTVFDKMQGPVQSVRGKNHTVILSSARADLDAANSESDVYDSRSLAAASGLIPFYDEKSCAQSFADFASEITLTSHKKHKKKQKM